MIKETKIFDGYWREYVSIVVYILNRGHLRVNSNKTPYELWFGRAHLVKYFKVFGSKGYIKRHDENFKNVMLDLMKVSFLDMLLPRKHTDATILGYIRLLRVHISRWMISKRIGILVRDR